MSVPEIFIRDDGKGFIIRKGGIDWAIYTNSSTIEAFNPQIYVHGLGPTIMEAVENALANVNKSKDKKETK